MPSTTTNYGLLKPNVNDPVDEDLWGGYLNDDLDDIDGLIKTATDTATAATDTATAAGVPIGSVIDYCGSSAPYGYLFCYGQNVSRTVTYSALFAAIGTTFGTGDGSTTFTLPDFRGRVGAGQDDMGGSSANRLTGLSGGVDGDTLGASGGAESHVLVTAELAAHRHLTIANAQANSVSVPTSSQAMSRVSNQSSGNNDYIVMNNTSATEPDICRSSSAGSDTAHNNVQPTLIVNKIIRYA